MNGLGVKCTPYRRHVSAESRRASESLSFLQPRSTKESRVSMWQRISGSWARARFMTAATPTRRGEVSTASPSTQNSSVLTGLTRSASECAWHLADHSRGKNPSGVHNKLLYFSTAVAIVAVSYYRQDVVDSAWSCLVTRGNATPSLHDLGSTSYLPLVDRS